MVSDHEFPQGSPRQGTHFPSPAPMPEETPPLPSILGSAQTGDDVKVFRLSGCRPGDYSVTLDGQDLTDRVSALHIGVDTNGDGLAHVAIRLVPTRVEIDLPEADVSFEGEAE